jgi:uncharacterized protein YfaS (alpha-2-macroglobulin family)
LLFAALAAAAALVTGVGAHGASSSSPTPFPAVATLPTPSLPPLVLQVNPLGSVDTLAQIRIRFSEPIVPLEAIESADEQRKLTFFHLTPNVPGHFRFITPRLVGFQLDRELPQATRFRVTVSRGLESVAGHKLDRDLAYTFELQPIVISLPSGDHYTLAPELEMSSSVQLDMQSLRRRLRMTNDKTKAAIPTTIALASPGFQWLPVAQGTTNVSDMTPWSYRIVLGSPLEKATNYDFDVAPGVRATWGNIPGSEFTSGIETYEPLAFVRLQQDPDGDQLFQSGVPSVIFNNDLTEASAIAGIRLAGFGDDVQVVSGGGNGPQIRQDLLEPDSNYVVKLDAALTDVYGQTLGKPLDAAFAIGDYSPDFWAPGYPYQDWPMVDPFDRSKRPLNIIAAQSGLQFKVWAINLPTRTYEAAYHRVSPQDLVYFDDPIPSDSDPRQLFAPGLLPLTDEWQSYAAPYAHNQPSATALALRDLLGAGTGVLAYGEQAQTYRYKDYQDRGRLKRATPTYYGLIQVTNLGLFSQILPGGAFVAVNRLSDGGAVTNARIDLYVRHVGAKQRPEEQPCATGMTDADGTLSLDAAHIRPCLSASSGNAPQVLVVARAGDDWAFNTISGSDEWVAGTPQSRSALFPDRDLYQPGETATFTGAAFFWQDDRMQRDAGGRYTLTLTDPQNNVTKLGEKVTDAFGLFDVRVPLPRNAQPGGYQLQAAGAIGNVFSASFRVAEFTPPAFTLNLTVDKGTAAAGETENAQGKASYLFGAPLTSGKASWFVTRQRWDLRWTVWSRLWDGYSFGRLWIPPEQAPVPSTTVFNRTNSFDAHGIAREQVAIDRRLPLWMYYTIELQASDATNRTVAQSVGFGALPAPEVIGVSGPWSASAGTAASFPIIVADRNAKAVSGRRVVATLELQHIGEKKAVSYEAVDSATVTSGAQAVPVVLTPRVPGIYRVRADLAGAADSAAETDRAVFVGPPTPPPTPTPAQSPTEAPLSIDYAPDEPNVGDIEDVTVSVPYPNADVYAAVLRNSFFQQLHRRVVGGKLHFTFSVTPQMAPRVTIFAHAVRRGDSHNGLTAQNPGETLSTSATTDVLLDLSNRKLNAAIWPEHAQLEPGSVQTLHVRLRDQRGHPAAGEFAVAVVDKAVLQLTGYHPPDLFSTLWEWWSGSSAATADNRDDVLLEEPEQQLLARFGFGQPRGINAPHILTTVTGDLYAVNAANAVTSVKTLGAIVTRAAAEITQPVVVRKNFNALAYAGLVRTDARGEASVAFKVPDSLTSWQVFAEAVGAPSQTPAGEDLRFGAAQASFVARKRLALQPLLPQFARPDDLAFLGVNVTNDTGAGGILKLIGLLNGPIGFVQNGAVSQTNHFETREPLGTFGHRFAAKATAWGTGTVQFEGWLNGNSDAFQLPLTVLPLEVTEHVVDSGTTLGTTTIPLRVDPAVDSRVGGLTITLASTLLPEITVPARQVFDDIDIPLLEPSASRLIIAADLLVLDRKFKRPVVSYDPKAIAAIQLDHLAELQNPDGGFSYYPQSNNSDPWDSAYAAEALGLAVGGGISVDPTMISNVRRYLDVVVDNPANYCYLCPDDVLQRLRLEAMLGLQSIGESRTSSLQQVWATRDDFGLTGQVKLARMLSMTPGWQAQARSLTAQLQQYVYESGRNATVNVPQVWWWLDSVTCVQSQMLRLFVAQRIDPEILDRLVRGLLGRERNGAWRNQYDTAQAIQALVAYAQLEPLPPNFSASARLSGIQVAAATFAGYAKTSSDFVVPMVQLPRNRSDLVLAKKGTGRLHYVVDYGYRVRGAQAGQSSGLRIERIVNVANEKAVLGDVALSPPKTPVALADGQVYDITLRVTADHPVDHVLVTDPLPAGLEAIDQSFLTTTRHYQPAWSSWVFNYQTIYRDRVVLYADQLGPGVYDVHYLARSVTPGTFLWPGANAYLIYAPEEFGRTASSTLVVLGT